MAQCGANGTAILSLIAGLNCSRRCRAPSVCEKKKPKKLKAVSSFSEFRSIGIKCDDEESSDNEHEAAIACKAKVDLADNPAVAAKRLHSLMKRLGRQKCQTYEGTMQQLDRTWNGTMKYSMMSVPSFA